MVRAPREFSYRTLKSATRNFDCSRIIGHGAFGTVYKGVIAETGAVVAVKRCSNESGGQGKAEFLSELSIIGALRHRNLVQLLGWCHQKGRLVGSVGWPVSEILLVYEFMPNGSLDKALFLPAPVLPWRHRRRILAGVASHDSGGGGRRLESEQRWWWRSPAGERAAVVVESERRRESEWLWWWRAESAGARERQETREARDENGSFWTTTINDN
ncbi:L-type lectin-domain containing receptor kinase VIII.1-like [Nymphaea colorata]|nr:L-type lectin-domain containing receptor kinase VIII.1-like [Nymphaea colorata]